LAPESPNPINPQFPQQIRRTSARWYQENGLSRRTPFGE
jgi:hypothetical protein